MEVQVPIVPLFLEIHLRIFRVVGADDVASRFQIGGWGVATTSGWLTSKLVPHRLALGSQPPSIRPTHPPLQQTKLGLQPHKSKTTAGFETKLLRKQKTYRCVCGGIAATSLQFNSTWNTIHHSKPHEILTESAWHQRQVKAKDPA